MRENDHDTGEAFDRNKHLSKKFLQIILYWNHIEKYPNFSIQNFKNVGNDQIWCFKFFYINSAVYLWNKVDNKYESKPFENYAATSSWINLDFPAFSESFARITSFKCEHISSALTEMKHGADFWIMYNTSRHLTKSRTFVHFNPVWKWFFGWVYQRKHFLVILNVAWACENCQVIWNHFFLMIR